MVQLSHPWNTLWNLSSNFRKKREIRRPMYLWRCNQVNGCTTLHILHIAHIAAKLLHVNWHCCYLPTNCLVWLILNARVYIHHQLNWVIHFGQPTVPEELHPFYDVCSLFTYVLHCTWSRRSTGDRTQETNYKLPDYLTCGCTCTIGADEDPRKPEPRTNTALHQNQYGRPQCGPRCQIFRTHGGSFPIRWAWLLVVFGLLWSTWSSQCWRWKEC